MLRIPHQIDTVQTMQFLNCRQPAKATQQVPSPLGFPSDERFTARCCIISAFTRSDYVTFGSGPASRAKSAFSRRQFIKLAGAGLVALVTAKAWGQLPPETQNSVTTLVEGEKDKILAAADLIKIFLGLEREHQTAVMQEFLKVAVEKGQDSVSDNADVLQRAAKALAQLLWNEGVKIVIVPEEAPFVEVPPTPTPLPPPPEPVQPGGKYHGFNYIYTYGDGRELEAENLVRIRDTANRLGIEPDHLAAVIAAESGFRTDAYNPSGASGLIQFMPDIALGLGTTAPALMAMTWEEQMPYVEAYLADRRDQFGEGKLENLLEVYLAVFAPARILRYREQGDSAVLYSTSELPLAYAANAVLDTNPAFGNNDGAIQAGELHNFVLYKLNQFRRIE